MRAIGLAVLMLTSATAASAASFDGSTPIECAIQTVMVCSTPSACTRGSAAHAQLPETMAVDVAGRLLRSATSERTIRIVSVGRGGDRLVLHGQESDAGTAWNMVIEQPSGAMVAGVVAREGGFLAFGTCSER